MISQISETADIKRYQLGERRFPFQEQFRSQKIDLVPPEDDIYIFLDTSNISRMNERFGNLISLSSYANRFYPKHTYLASKLRRKLVC